MRCSGTQALIRKSGGGRRPEGRPGPPLSAATRRLWASAISPVHGDAGAEPEAVYGGETGLLQPPELVEQDRRLIDFVLLRGSEGPALGHGAPGGLGGAGKIKGLLAGNAVPGGVVRAERRLGRGRCDVGGKESAPG